MPFNGTGTYTFPSLPGSFNPAIAGQEGTPDDWNTLAADLTANGLSNVICKDGQTIVTAHIPFANFRLKLVGAAALSTDAPNAGQVQNNMNYAADTGAADAYVIAPSPAIAAYAVGQQFTFKVVHANATTTPALAVSGLTAGTIKWPDGSAIDPGALPAGAAVTVTVSGVTTGTPTYQLGTVAAPQSLLPSGTVLAYAGSSAPVEFLLCDGSSKLRATYPALFAIIGTTYGSADGTHFNVPDLRGRIPAGKDDMGGSAASRLTATTMTPNGTTLGATGGEQTHTLLTAEMPAHTHTGANIAIGQSTPSVSGGAVIGGAAGNTGSTGGDGAHNNVQPSMIMNYIIKI